jgi:hypothetical protein
MPQESSTISSKFAQTNISTLVIMDEQEENTTIYSWKDDKLKKLPYDEHNAQSGQKIKTFYTFAKEEKVIVVNVNKHQMCISVSTGILKENDIKKSEKPVKFYSDKFSSLGNEKHVHRIPIENPILIFSLIPIAFGEEIKGKAIEEYGIMYNEYEMQFGKYVFVGVSKSETGIEIIASYKASVK